MKNVRRFVTRLCDSNRSSLLAAFARSGVDLNQPDLHGRRVVEVLSERTSNAGGLRELLKLGLQSSETAIEIAKARNAGRIAETLEQAL